ncbi:amidase [Aeromicrobium duanguangcaii]|uniref:Amidase n=1 Tax=Aeromicrobium duanguangcaii TaxID=2968086 RepID=A0ABY5KCU0_9ACTN|nr:amidase [Aeromicrobium duanguangcaii]MCD9155068.1 amidase [Aeromicrobium duanguangcaii]UUI68277.1 amidase [Aeromicrobium duanguangcaii]
MTHAADDGAVTSVEAVRRAIEATERHDPTLCAVITRLDDEALAQAARCDEAAGRGESLGALHGWTVAIKDNIDTAGIRTTSGSRFFADHVPTADAFVVERLKEAGAVMTSKVNLAEFALGATTDNDHYGTCRNAWDPARIPGGSSGGSAVAVAAGMARVSLGTDTGGSVRLPAAVNGLVGMRPTLGRISNRGVTPVSGVFDTVGPVARTAAEVAAVMEAIDGYDRHDPTSVERERRSMIADLNLPLEGLRVGVAGGFFREDVDPDVDRALEEFVRVLTDLGATAMTVDLPGAEEAQRRMFDILYPDAAAFHAERMRTQPELYGSQVLDRLRLGEGVDARTMSAAQTWRRAWQRRVENVLDGVDVIVTPAMPTDVPRIGVRGMIATTHDITRFTYPWAMFSGPSLAVPCGFDEVSGMPIAAHLTARPWHDHTVLRVAHQYQQVTSVHLARPGWMPADGAPGAVEKSSARGLA